MTRKKPNCCKGKPCGCACIKKTYCCTKGGDSNVQKQDLRISQSDIDVIKGKRKRGGPGNAPS